MLKQPRTHQSYSPATAVAAAAAGVRILNHEAERHHEDPHPHEDGPNHEDILMMFEDPHPQSLPYAI